MVPTDPPPLWGTRRYVYWKRISIFFYRDVFSRKSAPPPVKENRKTEIQLVCGNRNQFEVVPESPCFRDFHFVAGKTISILRYRYKETAKIFPSPPPILPGHKDFYVFARVVNHNRRHRKLNLSRAHSVRWVVRTIQIQILHLIIYNIRTYYVYTFEGSRYLIWYDPSDNGNFKRTCCSPLTSFLPITGVFPVFV